MVTKLFEFEAAHKLDIPTAGKCQRLHGHTYKLEISVAGDINPETGMIVNFSDLKKFVNDEIIEKFDHFYLNDLFSLPTAENMGDWIWDKVEASGFNICRLRLWETSDSYFERVEY